MAERCLWPSAIAVDAASTIPRSHLDAFADLSLFAIAAPKAVGGLGLEGGEFRQILRVLGAGCGATAFAFAQHQGVVSALVRSENTSLRNAWLPKLLDRSLGGTAFAHARRAGPAAVRAERTPGGWRLTGEAPWATSWGFAEVFSVAAVVDDRQLVWLLVPGSEAPAMRASAPLDLMVFGSTSTVRLVFDGLVVADEDVIDVVDLDSWRHNDRRGAVRPNPMCLGIGDRALGLLAESAPETAAALADDWALVNARAEEASLLIDASSDDIAAFAAVRAETVFAVQRLTTALLAASGGRGAEASHPAQLLARQALFYVVQAQNADGREATLAALGSWKA